MRCCMEVYVNFPNDKEGMIELNKSIAQFHAILVMESIEKLNLDNYSKKKVIKELLEKARIDALNGKNSTSVINN